MSEYTLTSEHVLSQYNQAFQGVNLREVSDQAIVSLAIPLGGEAGVNAATEAVFGTTLPDVGKSILTDDKQARIARLGEDQILILTIDTSPSAAAGIHQKFSTAAYCTDQTDAWVALEISGPQSRTALERICMLDLAGSVFQIDALASTMMEHLRTIIIRTDNDTFLLLSGRSSAKDFLHSVTVSIHNIENTNSLSGL